MNTSKRLIEVADYQGADRREPVEPAQKKVSFDPTINLGHVLTFIGFMLTMSMGWSAMDKRLTVMETEQAAAKQASRELDARYRDTLAEMRSDMKEMRRSLEELARNSTGRSR